LTAWRGSLYRWRYWAISNGQGHKGLSRDPARDCHPVSQSHGNRRDRRHPSTAADLNGVAHHRSFDVGLEAITTGTSTITLLDSPEAW
jgi:hypothetical protein